MNIQLFLVVFLSFAGYSYSAVADERASRAFSLFNVVKFKNSACQAAKDTTLTGVCYTSEECSKNGGTADGNCAASFGVCCVLKVSTCGSSVTQNCSYIENVGYPTAITTAGTCAYTVKRCSSEICQVRLDFKNFVLAQPSAKTTGLCVDTFKVVAGAGTGTRITPPTICGTNTNEHMYIDAGTATTAATLTFLTHTAGTGTWRVKVSQIACHSAYKAPAGCLQYFTGVAGTIKSFNFGDGTGTCSAGCWTQSQDYYACVRKESGMCSIQYAPSTVTTGDAFKLTNGATTSLVDADNCVTIAPGNGFIEIPSVRLATTSGAVDKAGGIYCGTVLSIPLTIIATTVDSGVVSDSPRFNIRVVAEHGAAQNELSGFSLDYAQMPCTS